MPFYVTVGDIKATARATAPSKWMICDGRAISRTTYAELFAAIGTTYGAGDGVSSFNIPNLKGRVIEGFDPNNANFNAIGKTGGEEKHLLTVEELPSHSHSTGAIVKAGPSVSSETPLESGNYYGYVTSNTGDTGGGVSHNILQPYMALNYLIFTGVA